MNYYTNLDQVAVIIHDDWGSGWYTTHQNLSLLFDAKLAHAIDTGNYSQVKERLNELACVYPEDASWFTTIKPGSLDLKWIPRNKKFIVEDYDGWETVRLKDEIKWIQA